MDEIWKDIKDYEGLYQVSNWGRVKSFDTYKKGKNGSIRFYKGKILKLKTNKDGYSQIGLWKNGKRKYFLVHRLVAEAFISNTDNLPCVNHKDENKQNNVVSNLEWCSAQYNNTYGTRIERVALKKKKPVLQYTLDGAFVREWASAKQSEREDGFDSTNICKCCQGKIKTHKDFIWKYK